LLVSSRKRLDILVLRRITLFWISGKLGVSPHDGLLAPCYQSKERKVARAPAGCICTGETTVSQKRESSAAEGFVVFPKAFFE